MIIIIILDRTWNSTTQKATRVVIGDKDLHGNPCNPISCTLAESMGITSFNFPPKPSQCNFPAKQSKQLCSNDFESFKSETQQSMALVSKGLKST